MVLGRLIRTSKCSSCHLALLRSFTGLQNLSAHGSTNHMNIITSSRIKQTRFSSQFRQPQATELSKTQEEIVNELEQEFEHEDVEDFENTSADVTANDESLPWYLQDQTPIMPTRPLSERQQLPELPNNAPQILDPLMKQISIDLGLDDLTLLDLRNLDPPPALGANLIMLLGTARSERHLHFSADRLCRWLRTEYKLRPDADGLLGRAELKLKLRRKARRAKLTGNGTPDEKFDDGVRTGWVCVNVGTVESAAPVTVEKTQSATGLVGFGRRSEGVKIVVQMLTDEKRDELDLERLWGGIIRRAGIEGENGEANSVTADSATNSLP